MSDKKLKPSILLIGQSRAGKSKFISSFVNDKLKPYIPIRSYGQTTKFITYYELVTSEVNSIKYEIDFITEEEISDSFDNIIRDLKKHCDDEEISFLELDDFRKALFKNEEKLFDVKKLVELCDNESFMADIYQYFCENKTDLVIELMIKNLYKDVIERNELNSIIEIPLDKFGKKEKRFIESIEPLVKKIHFYLPISSSFDEIMFNHSNDGLIFIDTVGTDHTGTDKVDSIFGLHGKNMLVKPDITTFINDFNEFRGKKQAVKSIFNKIIEDNSLSSFILVNTKLDLQLKQSHHFEDLIDEIESIDDDRKSKLTLEFQKEESDLVDSIYEQINSGLEIAIDEHIEHKKLISVDNKKSAEKVIIKCKKNSIFLSNPEVGKGDGSEMNEAQFELYNEITNYCLATQLEKYLRLVYENYEIIQDAHRVYISRNTKNVRLLEVNNEKQLSDQIMDIINVYISEYDKLRFSHYSSMRALSNGFNRKKFEAASSSYHKCFPDFVLFNAIKSSIKQNNGFLDKNYVVDYSRIFSDNYIFEDVDPIISDKLIKSFSFSRFFAIWNKIKIMLIESNQYMYPNMIDKENNSFRALELIQTYYLENSVNKFINKFEQGSNRWEMMGNLIGYQMAYTFKKNEDVIVDLLKRYILEELIIFENNLFDKGIILFEDGSSRNTQIQIIEQVKSFEKKAIIITEGKSDWKHYKNALDYFKSKGLFPNMNVQFFEYEEDVRMGETELDKLLESFSILPTEMYTMSIIGIFDNDGTIAKKYSKFNKCYRKNNVVWFIIDTPEHRKDQDGISVEFLYKDADLFKIDEYGRRLFHSIEFTEIGSLTNDSSIRLNNASRIKGKTNLQNSVIIDSNVFNGNEESIALSKDDFAKYVLEKHEQFANMDLDSFRTIFEKLETVLHEME